MRQRTFARPHKPHCNTYLPQSATPAPNRAPTHTRHTRALAVCALTHTQPGRPRARRLVCATARSPRRLCATALCATARRQRACQLVCENKQTRKETTYAYRYKPHPPPPPLLLGISCYVGVNVTNRYTHKKRASLPTPPPPFAFSR